MFEALPTTNEGLLKSPSGIEAEALAHSAVQQADK